MAEEDRLRTAAHDATHAALASPESEIEECLSFPQAVTFLEGKFDLAAARKDAVKSHARWGLVDAFIRTGIVENIGQYGALFDNAIVTRSELLAVLERLKKGKKVRSIFDAGSMTPAILFFILIKGGGFRYYADSYGLKNLQHLRRVDLNDIQDLQSLHEQTEEEQIAAFKSAYQKANPIRPSVARVAFTPDLLEIGHTNTSATQDLQSQAKGEIILIDPVADLIRLRAQIEDGLRQIVGSDLDSLSIEAYQTLLKTSFADRTIYKHLPDHNTVTRYADFVFPNGKVLGLDFFEEGGMLLSDYSPAAAFKFLGGRIILGK